MQADEILEGLNSEQREAVKYNDGPLLIVAGAGTGKTAVITKKIAYLIAEKLAKPSEILALTFTKKAAYEMEERVDIIAPYGYNDVKIKTFHSFAEEFLQENAYYLGFSTNFKVLSDIQQILFVRERIFDFDLKIFRPLSDPTKFIADMLKYFSRLKDEVIEPQTYTDFAQTSADKAQIEAEKEEAEKHLELARAYATYQKMMIASDRLDFGDTLLYMLKALQEKPSLLARLRQTYKYILVDEFQDTNYSQNELLKILTIANLKSQIQNPKQIKNPKSEIQNNLQSEICNLPCPVVTVVGDDDQSIYKFRGASVSNIMAFTEQYPNVKQIVLKENYRSTQAILDASYRLIKNNEERLETKYKIDKKLISATEQGSEPEFIYKDSEQEEAASVAEEIKKLKKQENNYSDFAILVRGNKNALAFTNALSAHKIPFTFSGAEGLFRKQVIKILISFLSILSNPTDNLALFNLLTSEVVGVGYDGLSVILHKVRSTNIPLEEYLRGKVAEINAEERGKIEKALDLLTKFRRESVGKNTGEILYEFLQESDYLKMLSSREKEGSIADAEKIISIASFFDRIRGFQDANLDTGLQKFMEYLDVLLEVGEDAKESSDDPNFDAVRVLTFHAAKGLEFDYVFMAGLIDSRFPGANRSNTFEVPVELIKEKLPEGDVHVQEERRLFYVGMTRAKKKLYLSAGRDYGGKRTTKVSRFVAEAVGQGKVAPEMITFSPIERIQQHQPQAEPLYSTRLKMCEGKLRLSRAEVDDYLTCPRKYKYIHITPIRLMTDPRVIFGRAVHKVIEEYYKRKLQITNYKLQTNYNDQIAQEVVPRGAKRTEVRPRELSGDLTLEELLNIYRDNWSSEGFLSAEHEKQRFDQGIEVIKKFVHSYSKIFNVKEVEKKFTFTLDDIIIEGRIDILEEPEEGKIRIIDFKTSSIDSEEKAERRAKESIQLAIYALAVEENDGKMPDEVGLFFLESGILGKATPDEKTIAKTKENIKKAAEGIRAQAFTATPDQMTCEQCPYSRYCDDSAV